MPCDSIILNTVDFSAAQGHLDILAEALRGLGYTVTTNGRAKSLNFYKAGASGSYINGQFRSSDSLNTDEIKQAFGKEVVKAAAKKFGWSLTAKADGKMRLTKRC